MKAQRYPPQELEKDIIVSKETKFNFEDLESMLKSQPFYLKEEYVTALLEYFFEKKNINKTESISSETFLKKIKKVIKSFDLPDETEED